MSVLTGFQSPSSTLAFFATIGRYFIYFVARLSIKIDLWDCKASFLLKVKTSDQLGQWISLWTEF